MNQKVFTDYVIPKILDRFPQFKGFCINKPNDTVDIDYKSQHKKLTFRLTTQDSEITIGFASDTRFDWHTHMNMFGANTPDEEVQVAIKLIDDIISNKQIIAYSTVSGYFITDDLDGLNEDKENGEIFETYYWSEL